MRTLITTSLALCILVSLISAIPYPKMSASPAKQWSQYKKLYNKQYSAKEMAKRKQIVTSKIAAIRVHNAKYKKKEVTYYKALTTVSDMTYEEYRKTLGFVHNKRGWLAKSKIHDAETHSRDKRFVNPIPKSLDLRYTGCITPVQDQGWCGACYAFVGITLLEYHYCRRHCGQTSFSVQQIIDCSWNWGNIGCYAGHFDWVFDYLNDVKSVSLSEHYPYVEDDWNDCKNLTGRVPLEKIGYKKIPMNERKMMQYVARYGPIAAGIDANMNFQDYGGGIYSDDDCKNDPAHAVTIVGYGREQRQDYWLIKNTNGIGWGEGGYMRMKRGVGMCGINKFPTGMQFTTGHTGYDCMSNSPCTKAARARNRYYFPHISKCRFVQCSAWGRCWDQVCGPGSVWSQKLLTCVHP